MTRKQFLQDLYKKKSKLKILRNLRKDGKELKPYVLMSMREKYLFNEIYKIGYLDIETSGLSADFDFAITYALLVRDVDTGKTTMRKGRINKQDRIRAEQKNDADRIDEELIAKLVEDISDVDLLIGHWFIGKHRHDIPFIRSRCAINSTSGFPKHKMVRYGDTQRWSSQIHRLRNNGLDTIADAYDLSTKKTPISTKRWKNASLFQSETAIDYIMNHNIKDVIITYKVHKHLEQYVPMPAIYA